MGCKHKPRSCVLDNIQIISTPCRWSCIRQQQRLSWLLLEIPSLPLENLSASYLKGFENKFICPIELSQSQTSQRLYTSKMYTELYNTMANSAPLNLSSMRCRICDLNGVPSRQLDKYTLVCLEIRDNPHLKEEEFRNNNRSLAESTDNAIKLVNNQ